MTKAVVIALALDAAAPVAAEVPRRPYSCATTPANNAPSGTPATQIVTLTHEALLAVGIAGAIGPRELFARIAPPSRASGSMMAGSDFPGLTVHDPYADTGAGARGSQDAQRARGLTVYVYLMRDGGYRLDTAPPRLCQARIHQEGTGRKRPFGRPRRRFLTATVHNRLAALSSAGLWLFIHLLR